MATQRAIGVQLRRIRAAGDIDAPSASNREAGIPVKSAPVAGPVGTSARLGQGPGSPGRGAAESGSPNQTGASCVKLVANRRRDGVDDVSQVEFCPVIQASRCW